MTSWVPSHVELTIHQARDLLLKTKNSSSVVYVRVVADREKCQSPYLSPSTAPLWQFTSRIPLMSLDTTLLCFVRQKTSLKDKFLGLVSIPLSTFNISSKPVTHWYKLGAKAGKTSSKLRGELLLSIKFLSNWVAEEPEILDFAFGGESEKEGKGNRKLRVTRSIKFSSSPLGIRRKSMLKRTKSEVKSRGSDVSGTDASATGGETAGREEKGARKDKSIFRLSIKKKTRSPVFEECSDEFMSISLPGKMESPVPCLSPPSSLPQPTLQGREGDIFDRRTPSSEHLSRSLDRKHLPNGHRTIDTGLDGGQGERGGEEEGEEKEVPAENMSPALRYNFRRKKRPWSMTTPPPGPQSEEPSPSTPHSRPLPGGEGEGSQSPEVVTYRAKSSLVRGVANGGRRVRRSNSTIIDGNQELSESCGESNPATPTRSPLPGSRGQRSTNRSRSSGLGNVALSSTLPASIRRRSQSVDGATGTPPTPRKAGIKSTKETGGDSSSQQSMAAMKSMGLGPRVPLATSLSDSPHRRSGGRVSPAHLVSEDHSPRSSPLAPRTSGGGGLYPRNPSPINLQSTLVEEEEEEGEGEEGCDSPRSPMRRQQLRQRMEQAVKSRVPIETESAAFQVDASELEVVLEAPPRRRSIVALPQSPSSSLPGSPLGSPARQRKLPVVPGSTQESESTIEAESSTRPPRKLPQLPNSLTPAVLPGNTRAHSTSPVVTGRGGGNPGLSGRSASTVALSSLGGAEGGERGNRVSTLPRGSSARIKHTVSFNEKSSQDYKPLPALPPCLVQSQTLPRHAKLSRRQSEPVVPLSTLAGPISGPRSTQAVPNFPPVPKQVQGLHNIRTFDPRMFELTWSPQQRPPQPRVSVTNASFDTTDSAPSVSVAGNRSPLPPAPTHTRSVTPETPRSPTKTSASSSSSSSPSSQNLSQTYPGGSPSSSGQERGSGMAAVVGGGGGGRRGGGALQAMVTRYQENRRRSSKGSPSWRTSGDFGHVRLTSAEFGGQTSSSAGSSPVLQQRKAATHLGHTPRSPDRGWRNPFSNLRRTQSQKTPPTGGERQREIVDPSRLQELTHPSSTESLGISSAASSPGHDVPGVGRPSPLQQLSSLSQQLGLGDTTAARNTNSNNEQRGSQIAATPTSLPSDTDSLRTFGSERTLVEGSGTDAPGLVGCLAAGQSLFLNLPPSSRHKQTCSSVDSEGLGSLASEEIEEAGPLDWSQWSKEELVRELVQTKSRLRSTEEELKAVRGYLDNLLLRIMETSPGILSVGTP